MTICLYTFQNDISGIFLNEEEKKKHFRRKQWRGENWVGRFIERWLIMLVKI